MPRRSAIAYAAAAAGFLSTCVPYLSLPPGSDGWKNLWLVQNVAPWSFLLDPLAAGYVFRFYFEPLWPLSFYPDVALAPWLGSGAYHVVNLVVVLAIAGAVARLSGAAQRATTAVVILLFAASPVVWFMAGMPPARNYLLGTFFSLLALWPFWRARERGVPVTVAEALRSAAFYALAVGCKEAMASWPAFLFLLDLSVRRRAPTSVAMMLPHTAALAALVAWRWHILGGLGGYWMQPEFSPENLGLSFVMLGELLWGSWWPLAAAVVAGVAVAATGREAFVVAAGCLVAALPFVFAGDLAAGGFYPIGAVRMLLPWTLLALLLARAAAKLAPRSLLALALPACLVAGAQWSQRPVVDDGLRRGLPVDALAAGAESRDEPMAVITNGSMGLAFAHQLRPEPKPPLVAYQSPPSYLLDRALGDGPPAGATTVRIREDWPVPELPPLDLGSSRIWVSESGHFRARLAPGVGENLTLTWFHENGSTRWVTTVPIGRQRIDLPLSYSVRAIVLSRVRIGPGGFAESWETRVWESPFFRPTHP